jgi:myo-inositol-1(or 4)-monophosphatase
MKRIDPILASLGKPDLAPILRTAVLAALKAGKIQRDRYGKPHQIHHKGAIDLVTEVDIAAEEAILAILYKEQSRAFIIAEESQAHYSNSPPGPAWIVDPLDGTTNYAHGFPWFGVSIAYAVDSVIQAGVIYCPMQDELFCAGRDSGAWLNGNRLRVSATNSLKQSLVATGFPYDIKQHTTEVLAALEMIVTNAQDVRRAGAAALDLAYVACGRLDGFWEIKLKPWDTAAGTLLVTEAGGTISDFSGRKYSPFLPEVLASNGLIHEELIALLKKFSRTGWLTNA